MTEEQRTDRIVSLADLKPTDWQRLLEITDRFEKAWPNDPASGADVDLGGFLPPADDSLRSVVLQELIKTDLEIRWRRGQKPTLEQYLERFPDMAGADGPPPKLVYEEYRVRQLYGDRPPIAGYQSRYPKQFESFQQLVEEQPPPTLTNIAATPSSSPPKAPEVSVPKSSTLRMTVVGDNKLIQRIGSGGFGEVYRAEAPGGVEVAVKVIYRPMDHEEAQRELQSLELVKRLRHPYLLQTHRYAQQEDRLFIVMELADRSLRDRLRECRQQGKTGIPLEELLRYFREAAEAIDFLHAQHVMHRDIKPENILLVGRHVKLADFGLARLQQSQRSATASGSGTPAYMAPEVWRGKISVHSDQYSLAVAYVEMRIDRRPFAGGDMMELMLSHVQNKPDLTPIPPHESEVLFRALAKDPGQRFASSQEFIHALEEAIVKDGGAAELGTDRITPISLGTVPGGGASARDTPVETPPGSAGDPYGTLRDNPVAYAGRPPPPDTMREKPPPVAAAARASSATPAAVAAPAPPRKRQPWKAIAALAVIGLVGGAILAAFLLARGAKKPGAAVGSFTLEQPEAQHVRAGDQAEVLFTIARDGFDGPVQIRAAPSDAKIALSGLIPAGANSVPIDFSVDREAKPGKYRIPIQAVGSGIKQDGTLEVEIRAPNIYRPHTLADMGGHWEGTSSAGGPREYNGRLYDGEIAFVFKDGMRIPFVLIPTGDDALPPFYISKFKISNAAYTRFYRARSKQLHLSEDWQSGALVAGANTGIAGRDDYPVYRVHVEEAYLFAQWLGGDLPKPEEWDKAAGAHRDKRSRGEGPFQGPWQHNQKEVEVAVNRETAGPVPNGAATKDVSYYQVHDMAGNGQEWTGKIAGLSNTQYVPLPAEARKDGVLVILRGRSFMDPEPLNFNYLVNDQEVGSLGYLQSSPDTSFRVVIDPSRSQGD